jgi:chondroitin AC lyase
MTYLLACLTLLTATPTLAEPTMTDEITTISQRLTDRFLSRMPSDLDRRTSDLIDQQKADGSWGDVDYDDQSRTHWKPSRHLSHLEVLSRAYRASESAYTGNKRVADAFRAGITYWIDRHPISDNWWYNVIGGPRQLSDVLILMVDELSPEQISGAAKLIHESGFTRTGANLVDEASNLLTLACATKDADLLRQCIEYITEELRITTDEGIQIDDSFHQHGPQQMIISYGQGFASDLSGYSELFAGTSFVFTDEKIRILSRFILDAQQWMIWGRQVDYHAMGRGAFRGSRGSHVWNAGGYARIAARMIKSDPSRAIEYEAFAERVNGEQPAGSTGPLGNKHFWRSDTMVQREPGWYASVRFHSTRVYATETRTNHENLKGYHLADGTYFILQRGDEYHEVQPVWNYRRLPGLTYLDTAAPIPYGRDTPQAGNTDFVGGASDGLMGVGVMDYDKAGVSAKKAYFFSPEGFICLGAGIRSQEPERVLTTLNQCRLRSNISVLQGDEIVSIETGTKNDTNIRAIHHDGIAYVLLDDHTLSITAQQQRGSWQDVEAKAPDEQIPQDIFTCFVDHGSKPNDESYAYRVVPGIDSNRLTFAANDTTVSVLSNSPKLQAVHVSTHDVTQAVFHAQGELALPDGRILSADKPCTLILRQTGEGQFLLAVSDPAQSQRQIVLGLTGRYAGRGASITDATTQIIVDLPMAEYAGQSVLLPLTSKR